MTRYRWLAVPLLALLLSGPRTAQATIPAPLDGACVAGSPRLAGPPGAELQLQMAGARLSCGPGGELIVSYQPAPVAPPGGQAPAVQGRLRPLPDDFDGWVYIWVNGRQLKMPLRNRRTGAFEPDAYVVRSTRRTVMPIRFFTEALGGQVEWEAGSRTAVLRYAGREVRLRIGSSEALVDGRRVAIDQPPFIWLDRTMIPTRFLMEALGARVDWEPMDNAVRVSLAGAVCMDADLCGEPRGGDAG